MKAAVIALTELDEDIDRNAPIGPGTALRHAYLEATTIAFAGIVACQIGTAFAARTDRASLFTVGVFSNPLRCGASSSNWSSPPRSSTPRRCKLSSAPHH